MRPCLEVRKSGVPAARALLRKERYYFSSSESFESANVCSIQSISLRNASTLSHVECTSPRCGPTTRRSVTSRFKSTRPTIEEEHANEKDFDFCNGSPARKRTLNDTQSSVRQESHNPVSDPLLVDIKEQGHKQVSTRKQPSIMPYSGKANVPFTSALHIVKPKDDIPKGVWPAFRMMDEDGYFRDPTFDGISHELDVEAPTKNFQADMSSLDETICSDFVSHLKKTYPHYAEIFDRTTLFDLAKNARHSFSPCSDDNQEEETKQPLFLRAHRHMLRLREMDKLLQSAQRQGRISLYSTCTGEEAIHMGSASALKLQDHVFSQYREQGVLMWRGFSLDQFTNQCFSNDRDLGKARQMPVHYGSRALNYHTVSSPLGTQIPQSVGAAYRLKLSQKDSVVICYFGEGCSSTTDFHSGLNFAATLKAPVIFFCRNNGFAISTPVEEQYAGDGVVSRGPGYGIASIRVDGNDAFAVHEAVRAARKYALENDGPVLIEAMTYRVGHHSTSDDSTQYRDAKEVEMLSKSHDPVKRMENFLIRNGWLTEEKAMQMREEAGASVLKAMEQAERRPKPHIESLFTDVYYECPPHLLEQQQQLKEHMEKHADRYS